MLKKIRQRFQQAFPKDPMSSFLYGDIDAYRDLANDEYVELLRFILGGWLADGNVEMFECCLRNMPEQGAIVEIGSFMGLSTNIIAYGARKYGRTNPFFACDPWVFAGRDKPKAGYFSTGSKEYRDWVMNNFRNNLQLFSPTIAPYAIEAFSERFFELWQANALVTDIQGRPRQLGGSISFAYIDGDHTYSGARQDFLNVDRLIAPGGYVVLDDSADNSTYEGLKVLVREIAAIPDYALVMKAPNYCFRKCA